MICPYHNMSPLLLALCLAICPFTSSASPAACDDDTGKPGLFAACPAVSSTATRAPKPLSLTAENVTVVTRKEIEALNAHTLTDVLDTIPGLQIQRNGGPGGYAYTYIQSTSPFHLLVMVDGVSLDNINNDADTGIIPARIIERIEIVKGSGSSSWGQALGGVINVITRSPERTRLISGSADASIGSRSTADTGAVLTGTSGSLGYLLSGGRLGSDGLLPHSRLKSGSAYGKLDYQLPERGLLTGTLNYSGANRENLYVPQNDMKNDLDVHYLYATLQLQRPISDRLELEVRGQYADRAFDDNDTRISTGSLFDTIRDREKARGLTATMIWHGHNNLLMAGSEYEHKEFNISNRLDPSNTLLNHDKTFDRYGLFLNDTITVGQVSVTPGGRFDSISLGDQFSLSLGITWQATEKTLLRGYTARGFSSPSCTTIWGTATILTSQIGAESIAVPYLWLKGTLFRNDIRNVWDIYNQDRNSPERRIALGSELEVRTVPLWNTSFGGGWTYTDTTRAGNGTTVYGLPQQTVQLALRYDDRKYRGALTGRYIWWNGNPAYDGHYAGMVWDLHLGAMLYKIEQNSLELFFSGHNILDTAQYPDVYTPNTGRWFEGGMKVRF